MKTTTRFFLVLAIAILLAGCATNNFMKMEGANVQGGNVLRHPTTKPELPEVDLVSKDGTKIMPTDAYTTLGIFLTDSIRRGDFTCIEGELPKVRLGELLPGSISTGQCIAVVDNIELFCQTMIYWREGVPGLKLVHLIEGSKDQVRRAKIIDPSLTGKYLYDLAGKEMLAPVNFQKGNERRKFVSEKGSLAESRPLVDPRYIQGILSWNQVSTPFGVLLTPLGRKEIDKIAEINPQYKFLDKWIGIGNFDFSPDIYGTAAGIAIEALMATTTSSTGIDYDSKLPSRREMGLNIAYFTLLQEGFVKAATAPVVAKHSGKTEAPRKAEVKPARVSVPTKVTAKAEQLTISAWVKAMAQKISRLGVPKATAIALAHKIERRDFYPEKIKSPIIARAIWKEGKEEIGHGTFGWSNGYVFENGERYEADGIILYRFMNGGKEVLYV